MTLPNFLILGAQKAGTSWLSKNLNQHPEIFIPKGEIHFFTKDNFGKGTSWYEEYFTQANTKKAVGEKSTSYLCVTASPEIPENIRSLIPNAKLIAVLRNPVYRSISAFGHNVGAGEIPPFYTIDDVLVGDKKDLFPKLGLLEFSRYYYQLKDYYSVFDSSQIMVLIFEEDIIKKPTETLVNLCNFLEVDPSFEFQNIDRKQNSFRRSQIGLTLGYYLPFMRRAIRNTDLALFHALEKMSVNVDSLYKNKIVVKDSTIRKLYEFYAEDNEKLFDLLGRKPSSWQAN